MHRITHTIMIASLLLAAVGITATAPAAAQSQDDGSLWDDLGETVCNPAAEDVSTLDCVAAANSGIFSILDRTTYTVSEAASLSEDDPQAQAHATNLQETYNANNATLEGWINPRFDGNTTDYDVVALEFEDGDANATRYLVAETDVDGNVTTSQVVNTTSRSVDHTVTFSDFAAADADSELERFVDEYAAEDKDIDPALVSRLGNRYAGGVDVPEVLQP